MKTSWLVILALTASCRTDPEHPPAADVVGSVAGESAGTIDGHKVSLAEIREYARVNPDADQAALVSRERRARTALDRGADVRLQRKQAMVRALLEDEVEAKVPESSVDPEKLAEIKEAVRNELSGFSGIEVYSFRVASLELLRPPADMTPERREELTKLVTETGEMLYASLPETDALEAAESLDVSWVDPALRVERLPSLKIVDVDEHRELPRGWVRANVLHGDLTDIEIGQKTGFRTINKVPVFAVKKGRIDAPKVPPEKIDSVAVARATAEERRGVFEELMTRLRAETVVSMRPSLLQESE